MNILITGAAGFLGRHVTAALVKRENHLFLIDNKDPRCGADHAVYTHPIDVRNYVDVHNFIAENKITHIIHLAAYGRNLTCQDFRREAWDTNVMGTHNVLEAARQCGVQRVVCCSSNIVLSDVPTLYKITKQINEQDIVFHASKGLSVMGLRPSNIGGPGQSRTEYQPCAFAGMDIGYERDGYISITGDGTQSRDFVDVRDVARAFTYALAMEKHVNGVTVDICSGRQVRMNEIVAMLDVPVKYVPARPGDAKALISDPKSAYCLGFKARIPLEQTVRDSFPAVFRGR